MKMLASSLFILKCSSFSPKCEENLKPKLGIIFEGLEAVEKFYKQSDEGIDFLLLSVLSIEEPLNQKVPTAVKHARQEEYEAFIGCNIPNQVNIYLPNDVRSVGRSKRIKRGKEINEKEQKKKKPKPRCRACARRASSMIVGSAQEKMFKEKK
jgi:hypothetical protein